MKNIWWKIGVFGYILSIVVLMGCVEEDVIVDSSTKDTVKVSGIIKDYELIESMERYLTCLEFEDGRVYCVDMLGHFTKDVLVSMELEKHINTRCYVEIEWYRVLSYEELEE